MSKILQKNGQVVPAMYLGTRGSGTTSGVSQRVGPFGNNTDIIRVAVEKATYVHVGDETVEADDTCTLLHDNDRDTFAVTPGQWLAYIQKDEAGVIQYTEGA